MHPSRPRRYMLNDPKRSSGRLLHVRREQAFGVREIFNKPHMLERTLHNLMEYNRAASIVAPQSSALRAFALQTSQPYILPDKMGKQCIGVSARGLAGFPIEEVD